MANESSFLKDIRLVTFDVFGTILDWRAYVEEYFPSRFTEFLKISESLQRGPDPVLPYEQMLKTVASTMKHDLPGPKIEKFARELGNAAPFVDYQAISALKHFCLVGAISNSDPIHQCDVMRRLEVSWDICITAADMHSYKPATTAWDRAISLVSRQFSLKPNQWLHVSAWPVYDLEQAMKHGIRTAFVPRPGAEPAAAAVHSQNIGVDLFVSDLNQLVDELRAAKAGPIQYRVTAKCNSSDTAIKFISWMKREHGPDLLCITGCIECRIYQVNEKTVVCEYLFATNRLLSDYLNGRSNEMRQRGRDLFSEEEVNFSRDSNTLIFQQINRRQQDFAWS